MIGLILGLLARRSKGQGISTMLWILLCVLIAASVIIIILALQGKLGTWNPSSYYQIPSSP